MNERHKEAHLKCIKDLEKAEDIIREQATMLQKKQTEINKLIEHISYAVYYMKQSGYMNYDSIEPEFNMYNELKTILKEAGKE